MPGHDIEFVNSLLEPAAATEGTESEVCSMVLMFSISTVSARVIDKVCYRGVVANNCRPLMVDQTSHLADSFKLSTAPPTVRGCLPSY